MNRRIFIAQTCGVVFLAGQSLDIRVDVDLVTVACAVETRSGTPSQI